MGFAEPLEMQSIDLSYNILRKIEDRTFQNLHNLQTLYLHGNDIEVISSLTFSGLIYLSELDLSQNNIIKMELRSLEENPLTYLNLSYNGITEIDPNTFIDLSELPTLDLSNNKMSTLSETLFNSSSMLKILRLSHNRIEQIEHIVYLSDLIELDFSHNAIL